MLDPKYIRENADRVREICQQKNADVDLVDRFFHADGERRLLLVSLDQLRQQQKQAAKDQDRPHGIALREKVLTAEAKLRDVEKQWSEALEAMPNIPSDDTPVGKDESANVVLRTWGTPPVFTFRPLNHAVLGKNLGLIESEKAVHVAGARFVYLLGDVVRLQYALFQWAFGILLDRSALENIIRNAGLSLPASPFIPVVPPLMIRSEVFQQMARLKPEAERYGIPSDDLFLIGSAEHTLGPLHQGETLDEARLPLRYMALTPAFRREAGSYGKDTKGILRLHQFDKLEMESFTTPEQGRGEQDFFVAIQEFLMRSLGIPHRVVLCSTGDQGDPDARHVDVEAWLPGEGKFRETHSADFMSDFQARRLKTKIRRPDGSAVFAHMNDATVLAMGRTLVAILENFQQEDGTIRIPGVLQPFLNGQKTIR